MNIPNDLMYAKTHEWVKFLSNGHARIGLTDHAQRKLTDIVFVSLRDLDETIFSGGSVGDVESIKAVSEVYSPLSGTVAKTNQAVIDDPSLINSDPYGSWLVELSGYDGEDGLLTPAEYAQIVKNDK